MLKIDFFDFFPVLVIQEHCEWKTCLKHHQAPSDKLYFMLLALFSCKLPYSSMLSILALWKVYTITKINGMLEWANFVQTDANKRILDSFDGAWHTKHIGTTLTIIFQAIVEWDDMFIIHDNISIDIYLIPSRIYHYPVAQLHFHLP